MSDLVGNPEDGSYGGSNQECVNQEYCRKTCQNFNYIIKKEDLKTCSYFSEYRVDSH